MSDNVSPQNKKVDPLDSLVIEDDGTPFEWLLNVLYAKDVRRGGWNYIAQTPSDKKTEEDIFIEAKQNQQQGEFNKNATPSGSASNLPQVEVNKMNPLIASTDPSFNVCPAYFNELCRVSGRPCVYSNRDYKKCGLYTTASTASPELFQISPGRENEMEYAIGIKA